MLYQNNGLCLHRSWKISLAKGFVSPVSRPWLSIQASSSQALRYTCVSLSEQGSKLTHCFAMFIFSARWNYNKRINAVYYSKIICTHEMTVVNGSQNVGETSFHQHIRLLLLMIPNYCERPQCCYLWEQSIISRLCTSCKIFYGDYQQCILAKNNFLNICICICPK